MESAERISFTKTQTNGGFELSSSINYIDYTGSADNDQNVTYFKYKRTDLRSKASTLKSAEDIRTMLLKSNSNKTFGEVSASSLLFDLYKVECLLDSSLNTNPTVSEFIVTRASKYANLFNGTEFTVKNWTFKGVIESSNIAYFIVEYK